MREETQPTQESHARVTRIIAKTLQLTIRQTLTSVPFETSRFALA